jgi:hypothetical protein
MTTSTSTANNRALTLAGANKIFEAIGLEIHRDDLGFYYCDYNGRRMERGTLTDLCRSLVSDYMPRNE